jgi:hypothetical protein
MAHAGQVLENAVSGERIFRESYRWGVSVLLDATLPARPDHSFPATGSEVA